MTKTSGIVVDNYKLDKFKEELTKLSFVYTVHPFTQDTSTIKVVSEESRVPEIYQLCRRLEYHFKRSN
jgi:hypothetical protein